MNYVKMNDIMDQIDIHKGDTLLLSSDMKRMIYQAYEQEETVDLNGFIDQVKERLGEEGTLLLPTYNWDFCGGKAFDFYKTPCKTGTLGKTALKRQDFKRTQHPIYSFAVWGKDKDYLCSMENESAFGADSPFAYLHRCHGKNLIMDVSYQHCFTFVHYVEEQTPEVTYRYKKPFHALYTDENGSCMEKTYSMFVRDLDKAVVNTIEPMDSVFMKHGAVKKYEINGIPYKLVDLEATFVWIQKDIVENQSRKLCNFIGQILVSQ